jgi:penicillin-binding protein 1C
MRLIEPNPDEIRKRFNKLIHSSEDNDIEQRNLEEYLNLADTIVPDTEVIIGDTRPIVIESEEVVSTDLDLPETVSRSVEKVEVATNQTSKYNSQDASKMKVPQQEKVLPGGTKLKSKGTRKAKRMQTLGCFLKAGVLLSFVIIITMICGASLLVYQYMRIASALPDINDLRGRASKFETTRILDRFGNKLYEIVDPNAGRRTYVRLGRISPYLVAATIATEDKDFYKNPGVDLVAIARAFYQNYQGGGTVSGASTITQQLARLLLLSSEERNEITYQRKIREAILATEITRRYSKDEILELYLNEIYYGNLAYGIEAAAETYFNTSAEQLTLGQAAFLAGLPQAPAVYDIFTSPDLTFSRMEDVFVLMYNTSQEDGCIFVSNHPEPICIDPVMVTKSMEEIRNYVFESPDIDYRFPHWVNYIRSQLEDQFDPQTIYRSGFTVYTTLDPKIQEIAQSVTTEHLKALQEFHVTNGAIVVIQPTTGEILAMVGSADFNNPDISGQVNMAISPRQPGSAIKPLTYLAAFEKGWTPSTLIWDVPTEFTPSGLPDDAGPVYIPVNYTGDFLGPVTVRTALANSLNIPAVKTLEFVRIYDDPNTPQEDGLLALARRVGFTTLDRPDYGLSLTLGGGEVTLLQLTNFFSTLANNGRLNRPISILRIEDKDGNILFENTPSFGDQVIRPEHTYLLSSILSDQAARRQVFGRNSILDLPFQAAVKTGTTNDFRDNWTIGYTPDVVVGVWVGNADYTPMQGTTGLTGAAPIWASVMQQVVQQLTNNSPTSFTRPGGIVEHQICKLSGTFPGKDCEEQVTEVFAMDQPPLPKEEDLLQEISIDKWTGLRASADCSDFVESDKFLNVKEQWARKWLRKDPEGQRWAENHGFDEKIRFIPSRACTPDDPRPRLAFIIPANGETIVDNPLGIFVIADATEWFNWVRLDFGIGDNPRRWQALEQSNSPIKEPGLFYEWDMSEIPAGPVVLRLLMESTEGTSVEVKITLNVQVPTPTPEPTPTLPPTETPFPTSTMIPTLVPTETLEVSPTPTEEIAPTITPSP